MNLSDDLKLTNINNLIFSIGDRNLSSTDIFYGGILIFSADNLNLSSTDILTAENLILLSIENLILSLVKLILYFGILILFIDEKVCGN